MPGKNKQQKNGFYFYMMDLMPALKREGRVFPHGLSDVVPIAHPRWKDLDEKEKQRYEDMAKEHKRRMRGQPGDAIRMDSHGNIIAHRVDTVSQYENSREKEINTLQRGWDRERILDEKFYFIDVQTLCKTEDDTYLPVEMAVAEFSLSSGLTRCYHEFLRPGNIPMGMRFTCQQNSDDGHQIPVEGHPNAADSYLSVQNKLENFLNYQGQNRVYPPVFALREQWDAVNYTVEHIRVYSTYPQAAHIKVYELESLFMALVRFSGKGAPPSKTLATEYLTPSVYDFHTGLKCSFHEEKECKHCSLLAVKKFCYSLAESLESCYDFTLKKGSHLPTAKPLYSIITDDDPAWAGTTSRSYGQHSAASNAQPMFYQQPAVLPRSQPNALAQRGRPAPIFRPPGAPDIDHRKNQPYGAPMSMRGPAPAPGYAGMAGAPSPYQSGPGSQISDADLYNDDEDDDYEEEEEEEEQQLGSESRHGDLTQGRSSTWLPPKSGVSWSRTTTPASTPRTTPMATPLATPRHSPPRPGAMFPPSVARDQGDGPVGRLAQDFPSLSVNPGRGRGFFR